MDGQTPLNDYSGLLIDIVTRAELHAVEFDNISQATAKYLLAVPSIHRAPFTYEWFLQLHREMFGKVWNWAGELRRTNLNIGVDKLRITESLKLVEKDYHAWRTARMDNDELIARLHHRLVAIHPFQNGNGRWARLAVNIHQRQHDWPLIRWPTQEIIRQTDVREEYMRALKEADDGDVTPLMTLQKKLQQ